MVCRYCGHELRDIARFCPKCGEKVIREKPLAVKFESSGDSDDLYVVSGQPAAAQPAEAVPSSDTDKIPDRPIRFSARQGISLFLAFLAAAAAVGAAFVIPNHIVPYRKYMEAMEMFDIKDYDAALSAFAELGGYKDSADQIIKCRYGSAVQKMENGEYQDAARAFSALNGYADSDELAVQCLADSAEAFAESGDYDSAIYAYYAAGMPELAEKTAKDRAEALAESGDYLAAAEAASEYSSDDAKDFIYDGSVQAMKDGDLLRAAEGFARIKDHKDSEALMKECIYGAYESDYRKNGASAENVRGFFNMGSYKDSAELYIVSAYEYGLRLFDSGEYYDASLMFRNTGSYEDSRDMLFRSRYELGKSLESSDPESAHSIFAMLGNYSDSAARKSFTGGNKGWYADGYTSAGEFCTSVFSRNDDLMISCAAGTDMPSGPVTMLTELTDSEGNVITAECENVRNSGYFSVNIDLSAVAQGNAEVTVSVKDSGDVLRRFEIVIV